jgi:ATP-dependent helicase/nuclease subunit B
LTAATLERICADETGSLEALWGDEAGEGLAKILLETRDSGSSLAITGHEWIGALDALISGRMVKPRAGGHPRAFIWGALEARLQHVDTMLMGALNEGVWPQAGQEDPFLSRSMKAAIGLEPPERRIGQAAHDFPDGHGRPAGGAVTSEPVGQGADRGVAMAATAARCDRSRNALALRARGDALLDHVHSLDQATPVPPATRPEPKPASDAQPDSYSFSEVATLRRDPYAIYARRILRLDPLAPFLADPGPRERGTLYHAILEEFIAKHAPPERSLEVLREIAAAHFLDAELPDATALIWQSRFDQAAGAIVDWEAGIAGGQVRSVVEARASLEMPLAGIRLTGMADRIDLRVTAPPGSSTTRPAARRRANRRAVFLIRNWRSRHMPCAMAVLPVLASLPASALLYLRLTGKAPFAERVDSDPEKPGRDEFLSPDDLAQKAAGELTRLVTLLSSGKRGFLSRAIPRSVRDFAGDYDHLARVAEWQTVVDAEGGDGDD